MKSSLLYLLTNVNKTFTPNESNIQNAARRHYSVYRLTTIFSLLIALAFSRQCYSQTNTWNGNSSANWNTAGNWSMNMVPVAAHDVVIPNGGSNSAITVNTAAVCKSVVMTGGGNSNSINVSAGQSLSVTNAVTINAGTGGNDNKIISVGTGTFSCASINMAATSGDNRICEVNLSTGTVNVTGDITMNGTAVRNLIRFTGAGILNLGGNFLVGGSLVPSTGTVNCNGGNAQLLAGANTTSFYNLTINKSASANTVSSISNAFTVANNLTVTQGNLLLQATNANYTVSNDITVAVNGSVTHSVNWDLTSRLLSVGGNIAIDGLFTYTVRSHVQMNGGTENVRTGSNASSAFSILTLVNGNFYSSGTLRVNDNFWAMFNSGGSFHTNSQTVYANGTLLNGGGTIYIDGGTLNVSGGFNNGYGVNGTVNFSSGILNTDALNIGSGGVNGNFNQSGGTGNISGNLLIHTTGTYTCTGSPAINISGNWINNNNGAAFIPASSTVTFNNITAAQNILGTSANQTFNHITINKPGQQLIVGGACNTLNLNGTMLLTAGTFAAGTASAIAVAGSWTNNGGTFMPGTGTVTFNGTSAQNINGSAVTTFNNLTLNNGNGIVLGIDANVAGGINALTFVNGKITTGSNKIILGNTGTVSGAGNTRYIYGNLQMGVATGSPTRVFEVGDASVYAPVSIIFNTVTVFGNITVNTTGTEHPAILSSTIDESKSVNRYWQIANSGVALSTFTPTFNFQASDIDAGSATGIFIIGRRAGSWAYPTMGLRNPTNTTATLGSFGEYAIGEGGAAVPSLSTQPTDQTVCSGLSAAFTAFANSKPGSSVQWEVSTDGGLNYTAVTISSPYAVVTNTIGAVTTSTLSINPVTVAMDAYEYRAVFTNSRGNTTSLPAELNVNLSPTVNAGSALSPICGSGTSAPLGGSIGGGATAAVWSTSSGGTFTPNANTLNATWTPPAGFTGTATLILTTSGGSCGTVNASKTQVVSALPPAVTINPASAAICLGSIQALTVTNSTSTTVSSGTINLGIPNNTPAGIANTLAISGIPAGATINSVSVTFNVSHAEVSDLVMNLRAPNGNILNLANMPTGGNGNNFTNTIVSSTGSTLFTAGSAPFNGTFAPSATNAIGATGQVSNVTNFTSLYGTPNGNWVISARDYVAANSGSIVSWSVTINWTEPITWSPITGLYSNSAATIAYTAGQNYKTVYAKPATSGNHVYTATLTAATGCTRSQNVTVTTNPVVTVTADYCYGGGMIQLTANSTPAATSWLWNTGATTQSILVDLAGLYQVTATTALGCVGAGAASIAQELVINGDFTSGNTGFSSDYTYSTNTTGGTMYPEERYTVHNDPTYTHGTFFGRDHTSNSGNFMIINGSGSNPPIDVWKETLSVQPNTVYYFSAWAISLNSVGPYANLQFKVNGAQVGTTTGALPARPHDNNPPYNWIRFYGTWNSGAATSAVVSIVDLEQAYGGNDFGLDDISFGTLSTFITYTGPAGLDSPTVCVNTALTNITYSVGSGVAGPIVTGLPSGVTSTFNGVSLVISGTPTTVGTYNFTITTTGTCNPAVAYGRIIVTEQTITRTSAAGTVLQSVCINSPITNITYNVGGSATGATVTGLPPGVTGSYSAGVFTISGSPTTSGLFNFTVTTTGTCTPVTSTGTFYLYRQIINRSSAAGTNAQILCVNTPITNITYNVGGTATGASVTGLPAGVTGSYNSGTNVFTITGTPTAAGVYTYTVTTSGTCAPVSALGSITVRTQTVMLTSAAGTNNQSVCVNTAITSITYSIAGTATGYTITGLPAGVSESFSGGVLTISGTPSVSGIFNYTITTSGTCAIANVNGTITSGVAQTIALTSAPGTNAQTACVNSLITSITYSIGGGGTGAGVIGLPAGVTGFYNAGIFTISGTPTVTGIFNYTITTTGTCTPASATGSLTVTQQTITRTSAAATETQSLCVNTAIVNVTYLIGGTANGASVAGLPAGVSGSYNAGTNVFTISGTPTATGVYNYTVTTSGPTCVAVTGTGTITVTAQTITLTSAAGTNVQTSCTGTAITTITYLIAGTANGASVAGLPAGVSGAYNAGTNVFTISGIPTATGIYNYTVTTSGPTCAAVAATGTITVTAQTISLTSAAGTNVQTRCTGTAITTITYLVGGTANGASVAGLPAGVSGSYNAGTNVFTISGTPTATGIYNYTVTTSGPTCSSVTATGTITVTAQTISLTSAAGTNVQTRCTGTAITTITYLVGGIANGASVAGLPAGVSGSYNAGTNVFTISGIPTATGIYNYTVTTSGPTCSSVTATGTITVTAQTISLTSAAGTNVQTRCTGTAITTITYLVGGTANGASVAGLPAGVSGSYNAGTNVFTISGTPTATGVYNYTVTTSGPTCSSVTATGTITVTAQTISLTSAAGTNVQTRCTGTAITTITYLIAGTANGASVAGLPAGVSGAYNAGTNVFTISGTPTATGVYNYTVTTSGPTCAAVTATGTITVTAQTISLTSAAGTNVQTSCTGSAITTITYLIGGTANGASVAGLPAGVSGAYNAGTNVFTISGIPTATGIYNYTVTTSGPTCAAVAATGTITVTAQTISLTSAAGTNVQTRCTGTAITTITYLVGGTANGASVAGLPAGVSGSYNAGTNVFTISGTPSATGVYNYTVTTSGPTCAAVTATGTITVTAQTITLTSAAGTNVQTRCTGTAITTITYLVGGTANGASVAGLPAGVSGSYNAGTNVFTISGTPTATGVYNYTVTTSGPTCAAVTATGTITVTAQTISLTSAAGTNVQTSCTGSAITTITYLIGGTANGASVAGLPAGVSGAYNAGTNVFTISGTPTATGVYNYTVTTSGPTCAAVAATGTITVTAQTISLTSAAGTNVQTSCTGSAITTITYLIGGTANGASVAGLPAGVSGAYNAGTNVFTISGIPTATGIYNYTVTTSGPTCAAVAATGTITVTAQTISLTSAAGTNVQTRCTGTAITTITYLVGGTANGASVAGLPAGVSGSYNAGTNVFTISGTPSATGVYNYTVTTSGPTCAAVTATGTITVTAQTITLTSAAGTNVQTRCTGTAITTITYLVGGTANGASVAGLPAGVSGSYNAGTNVFTISGTPTATGVYNYTVTTSGPTCAAVTATGTITVTAQTISLTSAAGTNVQTSCTGSAITTITYLIGGTANGASVAGLPAGVSGSYNAGTNVFTISGTPTATGVYNYTVTTSGPTCSAVTATGTITVTAQTISLTSAAGTNVQSVCINNAITSITYTLSGSATGAGITGLPAGISGSYSAGIFTISGTPAVSGVFNYTVTGTGTCNPATASGSITVAAASAGGNIASVSVCSGASGNVTLSGHTGSIIRWETSVNNGVSWTNISNTTSTQSYTNVTQAVLFRALVQNGSCGTTVYSNSAKVGIHNLWTGVTSSDWNTGTNWSDDQVPTTSCPDVVIPMITTPNVYPQLTSGLAAVNNLVIHNGASMVVSNAILQIAGSVTNNGILAAGNGTIELNGSAGAQTIAGSMFSGHTIHNLVVSNSNGVSFSGTNDTVRITGMLSFGTSNVILTTNNNLTIASSAAGTASVGDLTNGGMYTGNNITGNATVERYIPQHPKAWQFLGVPATGQTIKAAWQEGNSPLSNTLNPGYGSIITSNVSGAVALGFDIYTPSGPTMKSYIPVTDGWNGVANTSMLIDNKKGYMLFVRGDRSVFTSSAPATATTLRITGKLYTTGADAPPSSSVLPGQYESVGNPYASAIDFTRLAKLGSVDDKFYVWDPLLTNTYYGLGGYQTISMANGWKPIPGGTANYDINTAYPSIQSGQAFLIYSTTGGGTISFSEQSKIGGHETVNREGITGDRQFMRLSLYNGTTDAAALSDGNVVAFDEEYNNIIDANDALKLINSSENLGIKRINKTLALEARSPVLSTDTIFYTFSNLKRQAYQFRFVPENMDRSLTAFLVDKFTNITTQVSLDAQTPVSFTVSAEAASAAADRFYLVFNRPEVPLITSVSATRNGNNRINIGWVVEHEYDMDHYEIEKSSNGTNFTSINIEEAAGNTHSMVPYNYTDNNAPAVTVFYRIKGLKTSGLPIYSTTVKVLPGKIINNAMPVSKEVENLITMLPSISVYPNPVADKTMHIRFINHLAGECHLELINKLGQVVYRSNLELNGKTHDYRINVGDAVLPGNYQLKIIKNNGEVYVQQLIIQ